MPHSNRRSHQTTVKSTRTQPMSTPNSNLDDEKEKVEAAIFFLRCQEWMIRKYINEIRIMYLNPLDELCSGKKRRVESVSKSMECSNNSSIHGANKIDGSKDGCTSNVDKVSEKLRQALKALQREDGKMGQSYRPVTREKTVSLADCCALYRLKTMLEAMQELLDIQANLDKWFENNKRNMNIYKGLLKNLLINALTNFEMAYVITELFAIQQVPRQEIRKIKPEYSKYIRPDNDTRNITIVNKSSNKGIIMKDYIKKLEGQISHFRTVIYEIAKNLEIIIQTIVGDVRDHQLEVNVKQIAMIVDNLPPKYRFPETIHLSSFAKKLLANASPSQDSGHILDGTNSRLLTEESQKFKSRSLQSRTGSGKSATMPFVIDHVSDKKKMKEILLLEYENCHEKIFYGIALFHMCENEEVISEKYEEAAYGEAE